MRVCVCAHSLRCPTAIHNGLGYGKWKWRAISDTLKWIRCVRATTTHTYSHICDMRTPDKIISSPTASLTLSQWGTQRFPFFGTLSLFRSPAQLNFLVLNSKIPVHISFFCHKIFSQILFSQTLKRLTLTWRKKKHADAHIRTHSLWANATEKRPNFVIGQFANDKIWITEEHSMRAHTQNEHKQTEVNSTGPDGSRHACVIYFLWTNQCSAVCTPPRFAQNL